MGRQPAWLLTAAFALAAAPGWGKHPPVAAPPDLRAARQNALALDATAALARAAAQEDAANAAMLVEQEVAAASGLRRLEEATSAATARLAALELQFAAARQQLAADQAALMKLLPLMQRLSAPPWPVILATRESPVDAIRGVLIMQGIAAQIAADAAAVNAQSKAVLALLQASRLQLAELDALVARQQQADAALSVQIAAAQAVEMLDADTQAAAAAAAFAADLRVTTIQAAIERLAARPDRAVLPPATPFHGGQPVAGAIVQNFGDATAAGPAVGVSYRAAPGAVVAAPCAGLVLFADRFASYGLLVILDCGGGYDVVLSGMARLDVAAGQRLSESQPIGELARYDSKNPTRRPLLYVELRRNGAPVDPSAWLGAGGSG